jgi:AsmA protein
MKKLLKFLLIGIAALVVLLVALMAFVAATFNPNDYKPELIKLVKDQTGRTLAIPGEIRLTFFPRIGADLGQLSLSEPRSDQVFAAARQVRVSVALLPLFSRQVVVDRLLLDGLSVQLRRDRQGRFNFDDLLPKGEGGAAPAPATSAAATPLPVLDIGGIAITDAKLDYRDAAVGRQLTVAPLDFSTGPIADGRKSQLDFKAEVRGTQPQLALKLALHSGFTPDLAQRKLRLDAFSASVNGAAAGLQDVQLKLAMPAFEATPQALQTAALSLEAGVTLDGRAISARLGTALRGDLGSQRFELKDLQLEVAAPGPAGGTLALKAAGQATVDLARESARLALDGRLDSTTLALKAGVQHFDRPAVDIDLALGELDADRYLPVRERAAAPAAPAQGGPEPVIDLTPLQALDARGALTIAALKIMNLRAQDIRVQLKAAGGKAELSPLAARLYGGRVEGAFSAAAGQPQRLAARLALREIDIGPLMKDLLEQQPVDGHGNVALDLTTSGRTVSQFKRSLNGTASLQLRDGAINGINIAGALRSAKARLGGGSHEGQAGAQEKTDFTELGASFRIKDGVAHNDDLAAKTPLLRLGGAGDIFLAEDRLDYTVKATVVPTLQGQGGPELEQLRGLTLPVRLSGPYTAIGWKIDFGGAATGRAQQQLQQRQTQIREQTQKKLDEEKAKAQQRLKEQAEDRLKNLLRR